MRTTAAERATSGGRLPITLVTLSMADGRYIRVASEPVTVSVGALGSVEPLVYEPLLASVDEFEEELDVFALDGVGSLTQASIDFVTTEALLRLQNEWHAFLGARVEVAMIWRGDVWEDRTVILDAGAIQNAQIGHEVGQATTISVETAPPAVGASIGEADRRVSDDWPDPLLGSPSGLAMTSLEGCYYQWVLGKPYRVPGYKIGANGGATSLLLLAGHQFPRSGASYQITVYEDGTSVGAFTVVNDTVNGLDYAYVASGADFDSPDGGAPDGSYTYAPTYGGMVSANDITTSAVSAGDVLEKLLRLSGVKVDWTRMQPALARLSSWVLGVYGDEPANCLEVIRDTILPYAPLVEINGGEGLWFAYMDPVNDPIEADLVFGQHLVDLVGRVESSDVDAIENEFSIEYAYDPFTKEYTSSLTLGADNSTLCYLSQQLYGVRSASLISCDVTGDDATAMRILQQRAGRLALPRRIATYHAAADMYWLRAGMKVSLTDEARSFTSQEAVVTRVSRSMRPMRIRVECIDRSPFSRREP